MSTAPVILPNSGAIPIGKLRHASKIGQSKKGKTKQATVISDFNAYAS